MGFGAMFASMNSGLMSAEEVNRMVYAGEALRRRLGIEGTVAYHNDVPGSTWSYPRVLAGSGVKYLITGLNTGGSTYQPDVYNGNNLGPASRPFYWVGPDGSRVLQWFTRLANYSVFRSKRRSAWSHDVSRGSSRTVIRTTAIYSWPRRATTETRTGPT
jgi:hypothetical protein